MTEYVSKFLHPALDLQLPSEVAVLCIWNLSRHLFLKQVVDLHLLHCTGFDSKHADLFLSLIFTLRPRNNRNIDPSNEHCFGL